MFLRVSVYAVYWVQKVLVSYFQEKGCISGPNAQNLAITRFLLVIFQFFLCTGLYIVEWFKNSHLQSRSQCRFKSRMKLYMRNSIRSTISFHKNCNKTPDCSFHLGCRLWFGEYSNIDFGAKYFLFSEGEEQSFF